MKDPRPHHPTAVLVAVQLPECDDLEMTSSLDELERLAETLGFEVVGRLVQKRDSLAPGTAIGEGKLKELAALTGGTGDTHGKGDALPLPEGTARRAEKIIFDHDLTPNQLRNLQAATSAEVLDRSGVIVEIFHRHAKTREAKLQVEIARLRYLTPRLRLTGASERRGGGIGSKGIGETAHELDRRRVRDRIAELQKELDGIHAGQARRREARSGQPRVALVGYTNAGKSSLMRAMTGSEVLVQDKLFATLDTTVRALHPETHPRILVSDTVGFIKKLPHDLVASFRSTLEEAHEADLLVFVVDASDPIWREQFGVTLGVIKEIDASHIPSFLVLNKIDKLDRAELALLRREFPSAHAMSALNKEDVDELKKKIRGFFEQAMEENEIEIPYTQNAVAAELRASTTIVKESYQENGVLIRFRASPEVAARFKKKLAA